MENTHFSPPQHDVFLVVTLTGTFKADSKTSCNHAFEQI